MSFLFKFPKGVTINSWVYDQIQRISGFKLSQQRLIPHLVETDKKVVLDVGAGTGLHRSLLSKTAQYLWLDIDPEKLNGFQPRKKSSDAILMGDAIRLSLHNHSVDFALCIAVSHHLPDQQLIALFSELARVVRGKIIFLDAVDHPDSLVSCLLWKYDRGSWPRSAEVLLALLQTQFEIEYVEQYQIYHHYLLCIAHSKNL